MRCLPRAQPPRFNSLGANSSSFVRGGKLLVGLASARGGPHAGLALVGLGWQLWEARGSADWFLHACKRQRSAKTDNCPSSTASCPCREFDLQHLNLLKTMKAIVNRPCIGLLLSALVLAAPLRPTTSPPQLGARRAGTLWQIPPRSSSASALHGSGTVAAPAKVRASWGRDRSEQRPSVNE